MDEPKILYQGYSFVNRRAIGIVIPDSFYTITWKIVEAISMGEEYATLCKPFSNPIGLGHKQGGNLFPQNIGDTGWPSGIHGLNSQGEGLPGVKVHFLICDGHSVKEPPVIPLSN